MIIVLIVSWLRFFSYFLVISVISKLTITLVSMIKETFYFLLIVISYFLLMTTIFTTLFRNVSNSNNSTYSSFWWTFVSLYNYMTGNFSPEDMANY